MENQFVNYGISLKLTGLGFDQDCLATIDQTEYIHIKGTKKHPRGAMMYNTVNCPLYQQAFDFIREKHSLLCEIYLDWGSFYFRILKYSEKYKIIYDTKAGEDFGEYKEAREKALEKLIEICSQVN